MKLLAIDPGPEQSALLAYDLDTGLPAWWAKLPNGEALELLPRTPGGYCGRLAVEWIRSYGMSVGQEVFETCVWMGRFVERWAAEGLPEPHRIPRLAVKSHVCHSGKATDANIRQALIDRYGPGKDRAIGLKASPGPLYGLAKDGWSALAVAVTVADGLGVGRSWEATAA